MNPSKENSVLENQDFTDNVTSSSNRQRRMVTGGQVVAFTVGISSFNLNHLGDYHTIIFDKAITNIGNAYSVNSGIFQTPLKGVYVFTLTMMVIPYHAEYLQIVVDGNLITDIAAFASSINEYVSTTRQWVLDLKAGSEVWIRTSPIGNRGEIHGHMHTSFSGFLLFQTA
ncbi:complement C1q tumor necrosis factor-related protein 3-like [Ruditapes philippinarum]|uniref:complement C1q tumor necrosis factor-related protein 3-like n=1 Tax=Ruditapes philippinarum TaxID=129788 RepID=UPI00295B369D|nr:complement C1q tumor necrosis factor-related protein 3-like [Ruditapes philippinarum]